jgi:hypothetical protein
MPRRILYFVPKSAIFNSTPTYRQANWRRLIRYLKFSSTHGLSREFCRIICGTMCRSTSRRTVQLKTETISSTFSSLYSDVQLMCFNACSMKGLALRSSLWTTDVVVTAGGRGSKEVERITTGLWSERPIGGILYGCLYHCCMFV